MNTPHTASRASRRNFLWGTAAAGTALLGLRSGLSNAQPTPPSTPAPDAARAAAVPAGLQVEHLNDHLTVIMGAGGNIAVHHTDEAVFVIDAGLPDRAQAVVAAVIAAAGPGLERRQRVLLNTHYHFDHIGANQALAARGFALVATDECRRRNSQSVVFEDLGLTLEPLPPEARQVLTFGDAGMTLHLPDVVRLIKFAPSHTDGDAVALFTGHNVLHTGDLFFNGGFPVIDRGTGGSLAGMIDATRRLIDLVNPDTRIIPGHGPMATVADLRRTLAMLEQVRDKLAPFTARRATIDEVLAARPLADLDDVWGRGFLRSDSFTRMAYPRP